MLSALTIAASVTVTAGSIEQGQGAYVGESTPTYWTWASEAVRVIPAAVPAEASANPAAPTLLPEASASYTINAATAGATAVRWVFDEALVAPASSELELRFVAGLQAAAVHITVYVEIQAAVDGAFVYRFYWDAGMVAPGTVTVGTLQTQVLACTSVGHCP